MTSSGFRASKRAFRVVILAVYRIAYHAVPHKNLRTKTEYENNCCGRGAVPKVAWQHDNAVKRLPITGTTCSDIFYKTVVSSYLSEM